MNMRKALLFAAGTAAVSMAAAIVIAIATRLDIDFDDIDWG